MGRAGSARDARASYRRGRAALEMGRGGRGGLHRSDIAAGW